MLSRDEIESTDWAVGFLVSCFSQYDKALQYALNSDTCYAIYSSDETGELRWAVAPTTDLEFWMDSFETADEAKSLCEHMHWKWVYAQLP